MANFEQFNLQPYLLNAINALGFKEPTPIQERVIPMVMSGKSVVGQSRTGSGKSHAFLLPIFNKLNLDANYVQVVITAPSRELAFQLTQTAEQWQSMHHNKCILVVILAEQISNGKLKS